MSDLFHQLHCCPLFAHITSLCSRITHFIHFISCHIDHPISHLFITAAFCLRIYPSIYLSVYFCPSIYLSSIISPSILLSTNLSICPSIYPSIHSCSRHIYLSFHLSNHLYVHQSINQSICPSVCPSIHPSLQSFVCPPINQINLPIYLSKHPSIISPLIRLSTKLPIYPSIHPSM